MFKEQCISLSMYVCHLMMGQYSSTFGPSQDFPDSSLGKDSAYKAVDISSFPRQGSFVGERISYPLKHSLASLVAQLVKNPPSM